MGNSCIQRIECGQHDKESECWGRRNSSRKRRAGVIEEILLSQGLMAGAVAKPYQWSGLRTSSAVKDETLYYWMNASFVSTSDEEEYAEVPADKRGATSALEMSGRDKLDLPVEVFEVLGDVVNSVLSALFIEVDVDDLWDWLFRYGFLGEASAVGTSKVLDADVMVSSFVALLTAADNLVHFDVPVLSDLSHIKQTSDIAGCVGIHQNFGNTQTNMLPATVVTPSEMIADNKKVIAGVLKFTNTPNDGNETKLSGNVSTNRHIALKKHAPSVTFDLECQLKENAKEGITNSALTNSPKEYNDPKTKIHYHGAASKKMLSMADVMSVYASVLQFSIKIAKCVSVVKGSDLTVLKNASRDVADEDGFDGVPESVMDALSVDIGVPIKVQLIRKIFEDVAHEVLPTVSIVSDFPNDGSNSQYANIDGVANTMSFNGSMPPIEKWALQEQFISKMAKVVTDAALADYPVLTSIQSDLERFRSDSEEDLTSSMIDVPPTNVNFLLKNNSEVEERRLIALRNSWPARNKVVNNSHHHGIAVTRQAAIVDATSEVSNFDFQLVQTTEGLVNSSQRDLTRINDDIPQHTSTLYIELSGGSAMPESTRMTNFQQGNCKPGLADNSHGAVAIVTSPITTRPNSSVYINGLHVLELSYDTDTDVPDSVSSEMNSLRSQHENDPAWSASVFSNSPEVGPKPNPWDNVASPKNMDSSFNVHYLEHRPANKSCEYVLEETGPDSSVINSLKNYNKLNIADIHSMSDTLPDVLSTDSNPQNPDITEGISRGTYLDSSRSVIAPTDSYVSETQQHQFLHLESIYSLDSSAFNFNVNDSYVSETPQHQRLQLEYNPTLDAWDSTKEPDDIPHATMDDCCPDEDDAMVRASVAAKVELYEKVLKGVTFDHTDLGVISDSTNSPQACFLDKSHGSTANVSLEDSSIANTSFVGSDPMVPGSPSLTIGPIDSQKLDTCTGDRSNGTMANSDTHKGTLPLLNLSYSMHKLQLEKKKCDGSANSAGPDPRLLSEKRVQGDDPNLRQ